MADFKIFSSFLSSLFRKGHNLETDTLQIYLANDQPSETAKSLNSVRTVDMSKCATKNTLVTKLIEKDGKVSLSIDPIKLTASGKLGPFRYFIVSNGENLVGYSDRGSSVTLETGDTMTVNFGDSVLEVG